MADAMLALDTLLENDVENTTEVYSLFTTSRVTHVVTVLAAIKKPGKRRKKIRISNYVETIMRQYMVGDFRDRFRIERKTFNTLLELLTSSLLTGDNNCPVKVSPEKQLLIYIKYVATQLTLQMLADLFGVGEATAFKIIRKIAIVICNSLMTDMIKWPSCEKQKQSICEFEKMKGFPGAIGAIDGSHIPIKTPKENPENYINRKGFPSVILQAVCDADLHLIDIYCGWPGSVHDSRVLKNSPLCASNYRERFTDNTHLLGDAAYPLQSWLLTPYKDNGKLNADQRKYNYIHSSTRMAIERTFGSLKGRFRRLKYIDMLDIERIVKVVLSCCILHELCLVSDDVHLPETNDDNEINRYQYIFGENRSAEIKRKELTELLKWQNTEL